MIIIDTTVLNCKSMVCTHKMLFSLLFSFFVLVLMSSHSSSALWKHLTRIVTGNNQFFCHFKHLFIRLQTIQSSTCWSLDKYYNQLIKSFRHFSFPACLKYNADFRRCSNRFICIVTNLPISPSFRFCMFCLIALCSLSVSPVSKNRWN